MRCFIRGFSTANIRGRDEVKLIGGTWMDGTVLVGLLTKTKDGNSVAITFQIHQGAPSFASISVVEANHIRQCDI
jgi:hypothetical protein